MTDFPVKNSSKKTPKKLNFPLSENFTDSFDKLRDLLADLNFENFSNHLQSKKLFYNENEIESKIKFILNNLSILENLFEEKTIEQIKYNNESYLKKDLKKRTRASLKALFLFKIAAGKIGILEWN